MTPHVLEPVRSARAAVAVLVILSSGAVSCRSDDLPRDQVASGPSEVASSARASTTGEMAPKYRDALDTLGREDASDEAKLALIQELADDASEGATSVLLASTSNPSILVSMASIKALGRRPCEVIVAPLELLLDDQEWQRRAWAAKILGDTRCREALLHLSERLQRERDGRVQQRIEAAITALNEEVKG